MSISGIDLGTSTLVVSALDAAGNPVVLSNDVGELFTPSVVFFDGPDTIIVGTEARHAGILRPEQCVEGWKRFMGTDEVLFTDSRGKVYHAQDIAVILLKEVSRLYQERTGEVLAEAAVSVPANYTDVQKRATIEAGKAAGFDVLVVPHEPTCAVFGNGVQKDINKAIDWYQKRAKLSSWRGMTALAYYLVDGI